MQSIKELLGANSSVVWLEGSMGKGRPARAREASNKATVATANEVVAVLDGGLREREQMIRTQDKGLNSIPNHEDTSSFDISTS
jgi:hypothetical protein